MKKGGTEMSTHQDAIQRMLLAARDSEGKQQEVYLAEVVKIVEANLVAQPIGWISQEKREEALKARFGGICKKFGEIGEIALTKIFEAVGQGPEEAPASVKKQREIQLYG